MAPAYKRERTACQIFAISDDGVIPGGSACADFSADVLCLRLRTQVRAQNSVTSDFAKVVGTFNRLETTRSGSLTPWQVSVVSSVLRRSYRLSSKSAFSRVILPFRNFRLRIRSRRPVSSISPIIFAICMYLIRRILSLQPHFRSGNSGARTPNRIQRKGPQISLFQVRN